MEMPAAPSPQGTPVLRAGAAVPVMAQPVVTAPLAPGDPGEAFDESTGRRAGGFFNQRWVQNVLPLATSLLLHVGLIVVGVVLYAALKPVLNANKEQVVIPQTSSLAKSSTPGGVRHPGPPADPTRDAAQNQTKETDNAGFAAEAGNKLAAAGGNLDTTASGFLGAAARGGGLGHTFGSGSGGGGTAPWNVPGGGEGMLPKSDFLGTGGNANDVVFLCDASGSMNIVSAALKAELKKSVSQMSVDDDNAQRFNIIFFANGDITPLFKDGMHLATPDAKAAATAFLDGVTTVGQTNPIPAIKFAMAERPELLYVLTDGFDNVPDLESVVTLFQTSNPDGKTHINTIFLESDNNDPKLEDALKRIAKAGNGAFLPIRKSDM